MTTKSKKTGDPIAITKRSYNRWAEQYTNRYFDQEIMKNILNDFLTLLPYHPTVLDLGCGPGQDAHYLIEHDCDVTGIDIAEEMIRIARRKVPLGHFHIQDITKLDLPDNRFDGIWACASLLHIPKKRLPTVLRKLYKLLKSPGIIYVGMQYGNGEELRKEKKGDITIERHFTYVDQKKLEQLLLRAGFELIQIEEATGEDLKGKKWVNAFALKTDPKKAKRTKPRRN
jgi:SAM-dependent methyltransferase